jgi:hypothetical protein
MGTATEAAGAVPTFLNAPAVRRQASQLLARARPCLRTLAKFGATWYSRARVKHITGRADSRRSIARGAPTGTLRRRPSNGVPGTHRLNKWKSKTLVSAGLPRREREPQRPGVDHLRGSLSGSEHRTHVDRRRRPVGRRPARRASPTSRLGSDGSQAPGAAATGAAILLTESASAVVLQSRAFTSPESAAGK